VAFGSIFAETWNHAAAVGSAVRRFRIIFNELFVGFVKYIFIMSVCHSLPLM
jgi:hypothetical protein